MQPSLTTPYRNFSLDSLKASARTWAHLFQSTFKAWNDDNALRLSAALAYYSIFSLAPLLVITIAIVGLVFESEAASGQIYEGLKGYVGSQAASVLQSMVESASQPKAGIIATVVGGVTLLLGASGVLGQLKDALNTIWDVRIQKGVGIKYLIQSRLLNFGMVLAIGLLLLISLVFSSFLAALNKHFNEILSLPPWVWSIVMLMFSIGVVTTLFAVIFKVLPDARIRWRDVWTGALITAVLFEIGKFGLSWYLGRESTASAYGPASSVVLLILWVYYASCILLFGAEFTQEYATYQGRKIKPSSYAEIASTAALAELKAEKETVVPGTVSKDPDGESWSPQERTHRQRERLNPIFSHRLFDPLLKYLEGRGLLLSIEAKEALAQATVILVLALVCCIIVLIGWALLAVTLVGLLMNLLGWSWLAAVAITCAVHLLVAGALGFVIWTKLKSSTWFAETFKEFRKDRLWLKGRPN